MTNDSTLITDRVEPNMIKSLRVDAHCMYVLKYKAGDLRSFAKVPGISDRWGSTRCYIVDMSPQRSSGTLTIPTRRDAYHFEAQYDARWQVADPAEVVRANAERGDDEVATFLAGQLWPIGRGFAPNESGGAEIQIHNTLTAEVRRGLLIGSGLKLTGLSVRLTTDQRVTSRVVESDDGQHKGSIVEDRMQQLQRLLDGDGAAIRLHLAQNPNDTEKVLDMIVQAKDKNETLRLEWLDRMRDDNAIQDADYEHARAMVMGGGNPLEISGRRADGVRSESISANPAIRPVPAHPAIRPVPAMPDEPTDTPAIPDNPFATAIADPPPPPRPHAAPPRVPAPPPAAQTTAMPAPPREVHAQRLENGSVIVRWTGSGDAEYRVRRVDTDGNWRVVTRTKKMEIEDGNAPPGVVPTYSVSAAAEGHRSAEVRTDI